MTTFANNTMDLLIQGQMETFVKQLVADGTLNDEQADSALSRVKAQVAELDIPAAPKRSRTKKIVSADERCMARVWGSGNGNQCKSRKHDGDFCKRCSKLVAVTDEALQFDENGKHIGLFWGRFDAPLPVFSDGFLCVQWKSDESKEIVANALKEGKTWHKFSGEGGNKGRKSGVKKPRKSKNGSKKSISSSVKRAKNAYMFFLGDKRAEVRAALLTETEDGKVPVSEVAKKVGAMWKALDDVAKTPYTDLAAAAKAERDIKIAELMEAASLVSEENVEASVEEAGISKSVKVEEFDQTDPIVAACFKDVDVADVTEDGEDDDDEEEVEEHKLADGTDVLKGADGTLYDPESLDIVGSWNEADNNNNGEVTNVTHCVPYTLPHHLDAMYSFKETASGYNVITTRAK